MNTSLLPTGVGQLTHRLVDIYSYIDSNLKRMSPSSLVLGTTLTATITLLALHHLKKRCQPRWSETRWEQIGRLALTYSSYIKGKYTQEIDKQLAHFQQSVLKKWEPFGKLFTSIPEEGMDLKSLIKLIDRYDEMTVSALKGKQISGTIYSKSLDKGPEIPTQLVEWSHQIKQGPFDDDGEYCSHLSQKLEFLFTYAFNRSYLWNSLHGDEFPIGDCLNYQVVRMVASMFGGKSDEVKGFVTSGGTESLMLALRIYRNWGIINRGHGPGEGVVIASEDVHAAILKGGASSLVKVELVKTNDGRIDIKHLQELVDQHGQKVVAIIASAPSYPIGIIDPIHTMAIIAQNNGCGLHVDCCLGAFIINHLSKDNKNLTAYLSIPGVTSLSADNHKYGLGPKGVSTLVTKELDSINLAYHSIYAVPEWSGGVYGTPKDAGSQSCVSSFNAFLAMLATGKKGYERIAKSIYQTSSQLAEELKNFKDKLQVIAEPEANVVAFQMNKNWGLRKGAIYAFTHIMAKEHKIILNTLNHEKVHFCVTSRFAGDPAALTIFKEAVEKSLDAVEQLNNQGTNFPGDSGMYCALEAAMNPKKEDLILLKFIENVVLGRLAARDAVRAYFLAQLDPYKNYAKTAQDQTH